MSYNEIFFPIGVFALSTPGWWPCSPGVLRTDPDRGLPTEDVEEFHSLSSCWEILQYLLHLQLGSI